MKRVWKKGICCLLAVVIAVSGIPGSLATEKKVVAAEMISKGGQSINAVGERYVDDDEDDYYDYNYNEEETSYKSIRTVSELYAIRNDLSANYILMNDIDLSKATAKGGELDTGNGWTPITKFKGKFDGNGYRIKGMTIYGDVSGQDAGLFGYATEGTIQNLGLCDVNIDVKTTDTHFECGAIAGEMEGSIQNCFVSGKIQVKYLCEENDLKRWCYVGGLFGGSWDNLDVRNAYNTASIQLDDGSKVKLKESEKGVGGIGGMGGDIKNCYNSGSINEGDGGAISGGTDYIENCIYLMGSGTSEMATPLADMQMRDANYFIGFDFQNVWDVDVDSPYPYPQLTSCMQVRVQNAVLEQMPVQTQYNQGDSLNLEGGRLLVTYEDGRTSSSAITDLMVSGYDMSQIGTQDVIVRKGNMTVSYPIVVNSIPVTEVNLNKTSLSMQRGEERYLEAFVVPLNATDKSITWSTDNSNVVTVDQNGKVKALGNGSANVTVTAVNGVTATCRVVVGVEEKKPQNSNTRIKLGKASISNIKVSGKKLIMKWKPVSGASGYHIQIAKNKKFTKGKKNYNVSSSRVARYITGKKKTTYYIRMRAYAYDSDGDKVYGKYSTIKKKRIN